jgi:uncharacterized protein YbbC (DUF1343 family)
MALQFGIDIVLKNNPNWKQQRIGMLTNDAAKTNTGIHGRLALKNAGFNLVQLFSPEHGINAIGEDGALMKDGVDEITNLPIKSLYGEKFMPSEEDLKDIDIMLFDIPDAGTRFYTYLWSMTYWIEAAAKYKKQVIILDRPNPLGGDLNNCEGPMLDTKLTSFIGRFNIPIKHQCNFGELAHYFNELQNWNAQLTVIKAEGWNRNQLFYDWNLPWWNPSPALQNMEATLLYPGLCFFEATNVSIGRGTKYSFEWLGAEWLNIPAVVMVCQNILKEDIVVETETNGIRIKVIDPYSYDAVLNGLILLKLIKDLHPTYFIWAPYPTLANPSGSNHLSLLLGMPNAESIFELPLQEWLQQIGKSIKVSGWSKDIAPYLLYP